MFSQRIVAICLVALYGVPAAVGPHWHQHEHACSHSDASCEVEDDPSSVAGHSSHCCSHVEHSLARRTSGPGDNPQVVASHGACSICAFYAQAQFEHCFILEVYSGQLITSVAVAYLSAESIRTVYLKARGPPCLA
ncbi:hypothetical protein [Aureliella helgolandensis]|uniref:hypothetical protein n=1 Tax=Aureliella helgolandensis TaxID=2527968 RepID=UPI0011A3D3B8|nr:hypothetical protein [Aureliella helgolandensis]